MGEAYFVFNISIMSMFVERERITIIWSSTFTPKVFCRLGGVGGEGIDIRLNREKEHA